MANALYQKACLLAEQRRYDLAIQTAQQLLAQAPEHANGHNILSFCYARQQQPEKAIAAAKRAISLSPNNDFHHYRLADVYERAQHYDAAAVAITEALRLNPKRTDNHGHASLIACRKDQYAKTLTYADQGLQLDPEHVTCLNLRVLALMELGRIDEAEKDIVRSLQLYPGKAFPHAARGWSALHRGQQHIATEAFKTSLQIDPNSDWARRGVKEALKSENMFYRTIVRYELWQSNFRRAHPGMYWGYLGFLVILPPFRALHPLFVFCSILIRCLADSLLRLNPYGRLLFTPKEIWLNNCALLTIASVALGSMATVKFSNPGYLLFGVAVSATAYGICLSSFAETQEHKILYSLITGLMGFITVLSAMMLIPTLTAQATELIGTIIMSTVLLLFFGFLLTVILLIPIRALRALQNRQS